MLKRNLKIITTIIAFILCFPFHYIYDLYPNFITSIFFPINESIWEHMKLLFDSLIISGIIEKIVLIIKKEESQNTCFSNFIASLLSIPIFLTMFLPVYSLIGENFIITIIIMLITIIICKYISYKINNKNDFKMENKTIILVIITYILFGILTYYPIDNSLFIETETCIFEIH